MHQAACLGGIKIIMKVFGALGLSLGTAILLAPLACFAIEIEETLAGGYEGGIILNVERFNFLTSLSFEITPTAADAITNNALIGDNQDDTLGLKLVANFFLRIQLQRIEFAETDIRSHQSFATNNKADFFGNSMIVGRHQQWHHEQAKDEQPEQGNHLLII
jgi:hypothetical protein